MKKEIAVILVVCAAIVIVLSYRDGAMDMQDMLHGWVKP